MLVAGGAIRPNTLNSELLHGFRLGDLVIDPIRGQVTGRGKSAHLPPKAAEVLLCLAQRAGDLVTRDELLSTVWGEGRGSQEALGHAISEIRHALNNHHDDPQFIQTLPKRGFRLLVEPALPQADEQSDSQSALDSDHSDNAGLWQLMLRHGVVQAGAAYLVVGWLLIQVADATFSEIGLPDWSQQLITFVVIWGFPLLLLLAWFLEFSKGRIERDRGQQAGGLFGGLERNYLAIFIAYGVAAVGVGSYQYLVGFESSEPAPTLIAEDNDVAEPIPVLDNSLAVLKLLNIDGDARTQAFTDGLSEDILDGLARVPGLFVSARGDSWSMPPNAASDIVRRRLRVANYLEGSVRFIDDKLRVVVQLIDSDTGFHNFSRSFELETADASEMQYEIANLVVANMKIAVDPAVVRDDHYHAPTKSDDAYYFYQLGRRTLFLPPTVENVEKAIEHFDQALSIDDKYPAAFAGRCIAFTTRYRLTNEPQAITLAEEACGEAQAVAPQLQLVLDAVANLYLTTGRHAKAEETFLRALEINPQDVTALTGIALIQRRQQRFDEAERLMLKAIKLQPGNWASINSLGNMYFGMGRYAEAIAEYRKVVYLDPQNFITLGNLASANMMTGDFSAAKVVLEKSIAIEENATFQANLGIVHYYLGEFDESVAAQRRAVELAPESSGNWIGLADALYFSGDESAAHEAYEKARSLAQRQLGVNAEDTEALMYLAWSAAKTGDLDAATAHATRAVSLDPADPYSHYFDALVKLERDDPEAAIEALARAVETNYPLTMLAAEPILDPLKDEPRFVSLLVEPKD